MIKFNKMLWVVIYLLVSGLVLSCSENTQGGDKGLKLKFMKINYITSGIASGASLQLYVIDYRQEKGMMPKNNADLKLATPKELARGALKSIEIKNGHIILTYNEKSGVDNGMIILSPKIDFETRWTCKTDSFNGIEEFLPQCTFQDTKLNIEELTKP